MIYGLGFTLLIVVSAWRLHPVASIDRTLEVRTDLRPHVTRERRAKTPQFARLLGKKILQVVLPGLEVDDETLRSVSLVVATLVGIGLLVNWQLGLVAAFGVGWLPYLSRKRVERRRQRLVEMELQQFCEILLVATSSGFSLISSIEICKPTSPLLEFPFSAFLNKVKGGERVTFALNDLNKQLGSPGDLFVRTVRTSIDQGTSIASALKTLRDELLTKERHRLETRARQAPIYMMFPLIFLILPSFMLLTIAPIIMSDLRQLSTLFTP